MAHRPATGTWLVALLAALLISAAACRNEPPVPPEQQLASVLEQIREGLTEFAKQQGRYPHSLEEMVSVGILPEVPVDPLTNSPTTWRVVREETVAADGFTAPPATPESSEPIVDVRSGASGTDPAGVPWSDY
jgi:general secretion pathway protein G